MSKLHLDRRMLLHCMVAILAVSLAVIPHVLAQEPPPVACTGLPGCGEEPENIFKTSVLPTILDLLFKAAAAGAILAIIWGGVLMLFSGGDDSKVGTGRKSIYYAFGGLGLALSANALVGFFVTENWGTEGGGEDVIFTGVLPALVRITLSLFNIAAAVVIIIAGFRMALSQGKSDEFKRGSMTIMWAAIGAIIVNASKALVQAFMDRTISW